MLSISPTVYMLMATPCKPLHEPFETLAIRLIKARPRNTNHKSFSK